MSVSLKAMRRLIDRIDLEENSLHYLTADLMGTGYPSAAQDVADFAARLGFLKEQVALDIDSEIERRI